MLTAAAICLALNVFHEARGESVKGQYAVAFVTMNRTDSESDDPSKVCNVVFKKDQFTWTADYKKPSARFLKIALMAKKSDEESWGRAIDIANTVIANKPKDFTKGAIYFNERKMGRMYKTSTAAVVIGAHIFY